MSYSPQFSLASGDKWHRSFDNSHDRSFLVLSNIFLIIVNCTNIDPRTYFITNCIYNTAYSSAITVQRYLLPHSVNPLTPWSDQHLISPYNIIPESPSKVLRIKKIIIKYRNSCLLNKFSFPAPQNFIQNNMENMHTDVMVERVRLNSCLGIKIQLTSPALFRLSLT